MIWKKLFGENKKADLTAGSVTDISACHADLVRAVAASVTDLHEGEWGNREWLRIVVNYEALWTHEATARSSSISFSIARAPDGPLEKVSFRLSPLAKAEFGRLAKLMHASSGEWWTVCDLVIERDGRFDFQFSYGKPYRIDGNPVDKRFEDYLDRYRAEKRS